MTRALVWKEWRRLRALRWTLVGIGLALPLAFSLAAWAAGRGYGMQAFSGYSLRTILLEAVPAALWLGLWPLSAMVFVVQAFTADRADGTEAFLLDRPVSRARVWTARGSASLGSLGVVVLVGLAMVLIFIAGYADPGRSLRHLLLFGIPGVVLMVATVLAGLGATSLVSAPLPAFLLALLLTASPILAGLGGSLIFPYARWQGIPLAGVAACALCLAMPLASWTADTRGEPAGRGRRLRSALVLSAALAFSVLGFAIAAPFAVRAGAPTSQLSLVAPTSGKTTLIMGERGYRGPDTRRTVSVLADGPAGFLVDLETGQRRAFLAPEVQWAQWDSTGTRLAIVDNARPFGSVGSARLRFLDADGHDLWPSVPEPDGVSVRQVVWAGERIAVLYEELQRPGWRVAVLEPSSGRQTTVLERSGGPLFASLHALEDGRLFLSSADVRAAAGRPPTKEDWANAAWSLRPVELEPARLGAPVLEGRGAGMFDPGPSPSGRYWMRWVQTTTEIVEIGSGTVLAVPSLPERVRPTWLRDDSVIWLDRAEGGWTLYRMVPGEAPRAWATGTGRFATLHPSPGGAFAFVLARPGSILCQAGSDTPRSIEGLVAPHMQKAEWAGPHTLAATGSGWLSLYDVVSGKTTVVFGRR